MNRKVRRLWCFYGAEPLVRRLSGGTGGFPLVTPSRRCLGSRRAFARLRPTGASARSVCWFCGRFGYASRKATRDEGVRDMGLLDRLLGRGKKAAGDMTGHASLRREGMHQEKEGRAEDAASRHEELAQEERERAAEHHAERETT